MNFENACMSKSNAGKVCWEGPTAMSPKHSAAPPPQN